MKKKVLVIGPVMAQESDFEAIIKSLFFLKTSYLIDFIDPLSASPIELSSPIYYSFWEKKLEKELDSYDVFLGFSFGGVILQQCFGLFADLKKALILFSTPSFADPILVKKLGKVINLCKENQVFKALNCLYEAVFYPNPPPQKDFEIANEILATNRLITGLERVLATDSTRIIQDSPVDHLHLIGECSALVNQANLSPSQTRRLISVPKAGMRVLQDNPAFCQGVILDWLARLT